MKDKQIWIYAELSDNKPVNVYYELLGKARSLADDMGDASVAAVVLGNGIEDAVTSVKESGAEAVYVIDHKRLQHYNVQGYAAAFVKLVENYNPYMVLIGATAAGAELAPTVAGKLRTGLAAHAVDIRLSKDKERVNFMIPAFGGRVISEIYIPEARPMMGSVRTGIIEAVEVPACNHVEVINENGEFLSNVPVMEELVEFEPSKPAGKDIVGAEIVVAAGRGVTQSAWEKLNTFAYKLGAPIGWSRSLVDTGIVPDESQMIGTSGKSIKPKVFIGFGISGAAHFVGGMNKSKTVISVNKDENAHMFEASDYGIVGDADTILSGLLAKMESNE